PPPRGLRRRQAEFRDQGRRRLREKGRRPALRHQRNPRDQSARRACRRPALHPGATQGQRRIVTLKTILPTQLEVGDELPALTLPAINRTTLALYAGASGDHNPIHIDIDFARKARMPDVFAHGMLSAAYVARLLTDWVPQRQLRS